MPPCTIKRRTATIFLKKQPKLTENQTVWKFNNQGVKEKTFIQTSRRGGDGQPGGEVSQQRSGWQTGQGGNWLTRWGSGRRPDRQWLQEQAVPHLCAEKQGGTTGEQDRLRNPGFQCGEIKPQNLWLKKPVRVEEVGETVGLTGEFIGETHRVLQHTKNYSPGNQHQNGPISLWVVVEVTESQPRAQQAALFLLEPLPQRQCQCSGFPLPHRQTPKAPPLTT